MNQDTRSPSPVTRTKAPPRTAERPPDRDPIHGPSPPAPPPQAAREGAPAGTAAPPEARAAPARRKKRPLVTFKGICIHCGERFTLSEEEMSDRSFGFCSPACRMQFDMDLAEDID